MPRIFSVFIWLWGFYRDEFSYPVFWRSRPLRVYGLRKVSWRDKGVYICRPVLVTKVRFVHSVRKHKHTHKKYLHHRLTSERKEEVTYTLQYFISHSLEDLCTFQHTKTSKPGHVSRTHKNIYKNTTTHPSVVLNICAHYTPPFATAEEQDGHHCQLCWEYRMPLPACSTPK